MAILALLQHGSRINYLAKQDATFEELAVGYFRQFKTIPPILDVIQSKYHLNDSSEWKTAVQDLFQKSDKPPKKSKKDKPTKKHAKNDSTADSDNKKPIKKETKTKAKTTDDAKESSVVESLKKSKKENFKKKQKVKKEKISSIDEPMDDQSAEAPTTVDDFFITAEGTSYLSTAVVNRTQEDGPDDGLDRRSRRAQQKGGKTNDNQTSFSKKTKNFNANDNSNRFIGGKRKWNTEDIDEGETETPKPIDPNLHPSWLAKQKQKPTITAFKGTKIVFD